MILRSVGPIDPLLLPVIHALGRSVADELRVVVVVRFSGVATYSFAPHHARIRDADLPQDESLV